MTGEWMPIATVPKDGTRIRARQDNWEPCTLYWRDGTWRIVEYRGTSNPTRWMPLPNSPE